MRELERMIAVNLQSAIMHEVLTFCYGYRITLEIDLSRGFINFRAPDHIEYRIDVDPFTRDLLGTLGSTSTLTSLHRWYLPGVEKDYVEYLTRKAIES